MKNIGVLMWNINKCDKRVLNHFEELRNKYERNFDIIILLEAENCDPKEYQNYQVIKIPDVQQTIRNIKILVSDKINIKIEPLEGIIADEIQEIDLPIHFFQKPDSSLFVKKETVTIRRFLNKVTLQFLTFSWEGMESFLFGIVHFPSKLFSDNYDQLQKAFEYKKCIDMLAERYNQRAIVAGDFNVSPFDPIMTESSGFFAISNRNKVEDRFVQRNLRRVLPFYNPTWSLYGYYDFHTKSEKPSGSFYYSKSFIPKKLDWHLIDQVILTKKLVNNFSHENFWILTTPDILKEVSTDAESRKEKNLLDHLPLYFELKS
jgi:hypothetical protein